MRNGRICRNVFVIMLHDIDWKFRHVACLWKIYSTTNCGWKKIKQTFVQTFWNKLTWKRMSWNWLIWVMRLWSVGTVSNRAAVFTMEAKMLLRMKKRKWHSRLYMMTVFIVFCDSRGFIYYDSGSRGQTVKQGFSLSILQCIREEVWNKQLELWQEHSCFIMTALHHIQNSLSKSCSQKTKIKFFTCFHPQQTLTCSQNWKLV